jgi:hypothetical protein
MGRFKLFVFICLLLHDSNSCCIVAIRSGG